MYADKTLTCRDCGQPFVFTTGEQEFFASRGFTNEPSRCPTCRGARNRGQEARFDGGYESRERQLFPATCAQCGKETQVPFKPRSDRPVYCSDCYEAHRPSRNSGGPGRNRW